MSVEGEQETDFRDYPQINKAIDNINLKILELEQKIDRVGVIYLLLLAYLRGKLNKDELERISNRVLQSEDEIVEEFVDKIGLFQDEDNEVGEISDMLDTLEEGRRSN